MNASAMGGTGDRAIPIMSIVGAALVGLGLDVLFGKLDGPAAQLANLAGTAARETLGLLPNLVPAAWQVFAFNHPQIYPCPLELLVSSWPLVEVMAGLA
ncbi:MAG: hypothetical protein DMG54_26285 [Acidobacteria bacterium]|nr:MAG: hypothetical protein DMG54_26285 [Acidobacteriota bacterium]